MLILSTYKNMSTLGIWTKMRQGDWLFVYCTLIQKKMKREILRKNFIKQKMLYRVCKILLMKSLKWKDKGSIVNKFTYGTFCLWANRNVDNWRSGWKGLLDSHTNTGLQPPVEIYSYTNLLLLNEQNFPQIFTTNCTKLWGGKVSLKNEYWSYKSD